ncbi:MAG: MBL fold metallo-hydrolase [Solirubrobacterales bacterium]
MRGPTEIVPGVYGLGSEIVNWYLVEDGERLTAIDAGLPGFRGDVESELRAIGHRTWDVHAVVLTHSDSDHTGVAPTLRDDGARILIHDDDDGTLRDPGPKAGDGRPTKLFAQAWRPRFWRFMGGMASGGGAKPPKIEGAETFADGDVLDVPGSPRVVHTPGHTPGHCALLFEGHDALFAGDALCTWNPLTGRRAPQVMPSAFNVSTDTAFESLDAIESVEAETILTGHGEPWRDGARKAVAEAREART